MSMRGLFFIILAGTLVLGSCGGTEEMLKQMEALKRELAQVKVTTANNSVVMDDLQNRILLLQDQVESNQLMLARASLPEPVLPVVKLTPRRKPAEDPGYSMDSIPAIHFQDLNENGLVVDMSGRTSPEPAPRPEPAIDKRVFDARPIEIYKRGYSLLMQKQHAAAVQEFERFLEQYPNHDYSDNSLYWMGEAYYDTQNYDKALACFEKVVTLYPNGNKVPDALLKSGLCYKNVGESDSARDIRRVLLNNYPATRAASIAREKL